MIVNATAMATAWAVAGANWPTTGWSSGSIAPASAGSPIQPSVREAMVIPS